MISGLQIYDIGEALSSLLLKRNFFKNFIIAEWSNPDLHFCTQLSENRSYKEDNCRYIPLFQRSHFHQYLYFSHFRKDALLQREILETNFYWLF